MGTIPGVMVAGNGATKDVLELMPMQMKRRCGAVISAWSRESRHALGRHHLVDNADIKWSREMFALGTLHLDNNPNIKWRRKNLFALETLHLDDNAVVKTRQLQYHHHQQ